MSAYPPYGWMPIALPPAIFPVDNRRDLFRLFDLRFQRAEIFQHRRPFLRFPRGGGLSVHRGRFLKLIEPVKRSVHALLRFFKACKLVAERYL